MKRILAILLFAAAASAQQKPFSPAFSVVEATIPDMQKALREKRVTSRELVLQSLVRIATYEDRLNAIISVNPKALEEAEALDRERAAGKVRGPLHGIPIAFKDNIHTTNMPTTGGALVFEGLVPPYEATLTKNLREGGAIILAKTQMTELANWVAGARRRCRRITTRSPATASIPTTPGATCAKRPATGVPRSRRADRAPAPARP